MRWTPGKQHQISVGYREDFSNVGKVITNQSGNVRLQVSGQNFEKMRSRKKPRMETPATSMKSWRWQKRRLHGLLCCTCVQAPFPGRCHRTGTPHSSGFKRSEVKAVIRCRHLSSNAVHHDAVMELEAVALAAEVTLHFWARSLRSCGRRGCSGKRGTRRWRQTGP